MDALKFIPQVFFDLIARVVPGIFLVVAIDATTRARIIERTLWLLAPNAELQKSVVVWVLVLTMVGYLVGHLIAPLVRFLESPPSKAGQQSAAIGRILPFWRPKASLPENVWLQYDWLRFEKPDIGGLVAKLRAEYTMYGGLAVAQLVLVPTMIVATITAGYRGWDAGRRELAALLMLMTALVMLQRHYRTYQTFGKSVQNFYAAAEGMSSWKPKFVVPHGRTESTRGELTM